MSRLPTLVLCAALLGMSVVALSGCGDDVGSGVDGGCPNCDIWSQLTDKGGEFPAVHPARPGVIAYSSRDGDPSEDADIWVREEVGETVDYHRITNDPGEERLPAWSPDGRRIAFSRSSEGRSDIWVVDVTSFETPTDLQRVTTSDLVDGEPARSAWRDDQTLIFTNGDDIYQLTLGAARSASLVELIPDPSDEILGLGLKFRENQPAFVRTLAGSELLAFISEGRGPQGNIAVSAFAETGEQIAAIITVDQKPLLNPDRDTLRTPFNIFGIAPATYRVGITTTGGQNGLCDTSLAMDVQVNANEVRQAEFIVTRPRGALRILATPNPNTRIIVVTPGGGSIDFGGVAAETTHAGCLLAGDSSFYQVLLFGAGVLRDSTTIQVLERKISQVCLSGALGGCPDSLDIVGVDTLIYAPPADTSESGEEGEAWEMAQKAPGARQSPAATESDLWFYDLAADTLHAVTMDAASQAHPAWSADGRYIAYVEDDRGLRSLRVVNTESFALRSIPLPGRESTTICNRTVGHPCWTPSGLQIVVSLSNCDDEIETGEHFDVWAVDVSSLLP
jgi:dipeptidyl aminopeptidase/acylaminoacyl peptidase